MFNFKRLIVIAILAGLFLNNPFPCRAQADSLEEDDISIFSREWVMEKQMQKLGQKRNTAIDREFYILEKNEKMKFFFILNQTGPLNLPNQTAPALFLSGFPLKIPRML